MPSKQSDFENGHPRLTSPGSPGGRGQTGPNPGTASMGGCPCGGGGASHNKMVSPEKRRPEEQNMPIIHRTSVVGLFIRRIILCFDKLNFSEVSHLYHNFKQYCGEGKFHY